MFQHKRDRSHKSQVSVRLPSKNKDRRDGKDVAHGLLAIPSFLLMQMPAFFPTAPRCRFRILPNILLSGSFQYYKNINITYLPPLM